MLRLDREGLTADGVRVGISEAVKRCMRAGRTDLTVTADALRHRLHRSDGRARVRRHPSCRRTRPPEGRATPRPPPPAPWPTLICRRSRAPSDLSPSRSSPIRRRPASRAGGSGSVRSSSRPSGARSAGRTTRASRAPRSMSCSSAPTASSSIVLARADLVAVMDSGEVRDSEIKHPAGAEFHFVVNERGGGGR